MIIKRKLFARIKLPQGKRDGLTKEEQDNVNDSLDKINSGEDYERTIDEDIEEDNKQNKRRKKKRDNSGITVAQIVERSRQK